MSDRPTSQSSWRALAEKELRGAPFSSLTPKRHDGIAIEPFLGPDPAREEGLSDAPRTRGSLLVTDRARDLALAAGADGVWWRGSEPPPDGARVTLVETRTDPITVEARIATAEGIAKQSVVALTDVHESGGSAITEVAVGVAAIVEISRRRGGAPSELRVALSVGPELFLEIAKIRALRRLSARVLRTLGIDASLWIAARTAQRSLARLDVATNVVRGSIGAAAAMLGGADVVGVLAMDAELEDPTPLSARIARNVPLVLARESSLWAVDDPARGSFEIEALTDRIARDAWEVVREIERAGGLVAARSLVRARIDRDSEARAAAVRTRRIPIVGVSKHPSASDHVTPAPLDVRDASPFEIARAAPRVAVELVRLGGGELDARVEFVREVLAVGGFDVVASGGRVAVVCAADAAFETDVPRALSELRTRGVPAFVAGKPGASEGALRGAGALGFVAVGQDVVEFAAAVRAAAGAGT